MLIWCIERVCCEGVLRLCWEGVLPSYSSIISSAICKAFSRMIAISSSVGSPVKIVVGALMG